MERGEDIVGEKVVEIAKYYGLSWIVLFSQMHVLENSYCGVKMKSALLFQLLSLLLACKIKSLYLYFLTSHGETLATN